jgi:hypothetical protein
MLNATETELSRLIARIISVMYLSVAVGGIFSADHYRRLRDDMFKNTALTYFMGFTAVIIGFFMVNYHNIWAKNWTVLITIMGWLALTKGILIIAFPRFFQSFSRPFFKGRVSRILPYVWIFIGLLFGYFGFVA